ncbi:hypothetical protein RND71_032167 [Anisodus tanguticus]|uniref:Uncharacterized protein n=1 Tax=Anisodus tanguticus TaxID=243964 RepID=A0AAE1REW5_9SOLA|nr:hypothetical protein RND71_032167 [Anisodus tanguticus]
MSWLRTYDSLVILVALPTEHVGLLGEKDLSFILAQKFYFPSLQLWRPQKSTDIFSSANVVSCSNQQN